LSGSKMKDLVATRRVELAGRDQMDRCCHDEEET
jgi:hypothetical protein